jgi:uncharacterized protein (TIGR04255 family)
MSEIIHPQLPRSPLVLVVAQVRFSPVENIQNKYIPEIHERLRMLGYPYLETLQIFSHVVMTDQGIPLQSKIEPSFFFTDKSKQTNIVLSRNSIVVNTVKYNTFTEYIQKVITAVEELLQILKLTEFGVLERVSLRYVDWIYSLDEIPLENMINGAYLGGFLSDSNVQLRQVIIERNTDIGGIVRTIIFRPRDLQMVLGEFQSIRLNQPKFTKGSDFIILDMEHYKLPQGEDFSQKYILSTFEELHGELDCLFFEQIPSKEALELWGKER